MHSQTRAPDSLLSAAVTFGIGGGFAQQSPLGPSGGDAVGYAAHANVEVGTPLTFLRLRGEGLYAYWGQSDRVGALTAQLVAKPDVRWRARPYLLGGGGAYSVPNGGLSRGWTLGAGLEISLGRGAVTVESRMHAFHLGNEGAGRTRPEHFEPRIGAWRHTYTPLLFGLKF